MLWIRSKISVENRSKCLNSYLISTLDFKNAYIYFEQSAEEKFVIQYDF